MCLGVCAHVRALSGTSERLPVSAYFNLDGIFLDTKCDGIIAYYLSFTRSFHFQCLCSDIEIQQRETLETRYFSDS